MKHALSTSRSLAALIAATSLALSLTACAAADERASIATEDVSTASAAPEVPGAHPAPGRTIDATPPVEPADLRGVRIALVVPDAGPVSSALRVAVENFAAANGLVVEEFAGAGDAASVDAAFAAALATEPHVVVGLGDGSVDAFAYSSPQALDQEFLLLGAQLAEPTSNVTAVVWTGATSRGSGAPADGELDEGAVTAARATDAVSVGVNAVMSGTSGIVLHLTR